MSVNSFSSSYFIVNVISLAGMLWMKPSITHLWLKFCKGIDKHWIVPVRKLFYFHHCKVAECSTTARIN